jgi:hypothetical protein
VAVAEEMANSGPDNELASALLAEIIGPEIVAELEAIAATDAITTSQLVGEVLRSFARERREADLLALQLARVQLPRIGKPPARREAPSLRQRLAAGALLAFLGLIILGPWTLGVMFVVLLFWS